MEQTWGRWKKHLQQIDQAFYSSSKVTGMAKTSTEIGAVEAVLQAIMWESEQRGIMYFLHKKKHSLHSQAQIELALFHNISLLPLF